MVLFLSSSKSQPKLMTDNNFANVCVKAQKVCFIREGLCVNPNIGRKIKKKKVVWR